MVCVLRTTRMHVKGVDTRSDAKGRWRFNISRPSVCARVNSRVYVVRKDLQWSTKHARVTFGLKKGSINRFLKLKLPS